MKKELTIPVISAAGGLLALLLRVWQNRTGFEAATGLPVPGAAAGRLLLLALALLAAVLLFLAFRLPEEETPALPESFGGGSPLWELITAAGGLLLFLSGLVDLLEGLGFGNLMVRMRAAADPEAALYGDLAFSAGGVFPSQVQLLLGVCGILSAGGVLLVLVSCRRQEPCKAPVLLLAPPVGLVIRLVLVYRLDSVDPALESYYVEILALVFLTLGFYRLSSFAFQSGKTRRFAAYGSLGVVMGLAALCDGGMELSSPLLYGGGALALLGFLGMRLGGEARKAEAEEGEAN